MKVLSITTAFLAAIFFAGVAVNSVMAAPEGGPRIPDCENFVDLDLDGVNDNCTGEGLRPQDGTGEQKGGRKGAGAGGGTGEGNPDCPLFLDEDGDGINDACSSVRNRLANGAGAKRRMNKRVPRSSDVSGSATAPGIQDRDQLRDDSCDGTGRKTRRGVRR